MVGHVSRAVPFSCNVLMNSSSRDDTAKASPLRNWRFGNSRPVSPVLFESKLYLLTPSRDVIPWRKTRTHV